MSYFVKFSCGCVGMLDPDRDQQEARIVKICDEDQCTPIGSLYWHKRDMRDKTFETLSEEDEIHLHRTIMRQFQLAENYREIKRLLGLHHYDYEIKKLWEQK